MAYTEEEVEILLRALMNIDGRTLNNYKCKIHLWCACVVLIFVEPIAAVLAQRYVMLHTVKLYGRSRL